ncbi:hypothetical protein [Rhodobium gokarnense]|uniref:Uncharacterized protein n=1 Tax=Rhodobium gokarnense TaxID=364296 RepID=A0ABT3H8C1_9HYPH|nr:hypothetical protein [Rhodobium gokarnense]MCW2306635.1 hypothetical protein [Rhodobium gokarnense]
MTTFKKTLTALMLMVGLAMATTTFTTVTTTEAAAGPVKGLSSTGLGSGRIFGW